MVLVEAQRRLDQQRADVIRSRNEAFSDVQRRQQISAQKIKLDAQRLRDRRNDIETENEVQRAFEEQQRIQDTVDNDTLFERNQIAIKEEFAQRAEDQRQAKIEREIRTIERRIADRDAEIQARLDLRVSLDRISQAGGTPLRPQDSTPGNLLDVQA